MMLNSMGVQGSHSFVVMLLRAECWLILVVLMMKMIKPAC